MSGNGRVYWAGFWWAVTLALVYTLLNALKPLHIDDTHYYTYARQIAAHPTDPYGFSILFFSSLRPAHQVLCPPVFPYWLAAGIALFGPQPFLWKLWVLPFSLVFVLSLWSLARRFARGMETPLLCLIVLSPVFLPSLNLMVDVPAQALGLLALVLFLRASDRDLGLLAVAAGVVAGLGMQTKYTALLAPAVMLPYALLAKRVRLWCFAALAATVVFGTWEAFVAFRYGHSHFLFESGEFQRTAELNLNLAIGLLTQLGGTAAAVGLLGLAACGGPGWLVAAFSLAIVSVYGCLALGVFDLGKVIVPAPGMAALAEGDLLFGSLGLFVLATLLAGSAMLLKHRSPGRRDTIFLVAWLAVELAGAFAISPFPAVRRLMGILIAGSLLLGRLAAERGVAVRQR